MIIERAWRAPGLSCARLGMPARGASHRAGDPGPERNGIQTNPRPCVRPNEPGAQAHPNRTLRRW